MPGVGAARSRHRAHPASRAPPPAPRRPDRRTTAVPSTAITGPVAPTARRAPGATRTAPAAGRPCSTGRSRSARRPDSRARRSDGRTAVLSTAGQRTRRPATAPGLPAARSPCPATPPPAGRRPDHRAQAPLLPPSITAPGPRPPHRSADYRTWQPAARTPRPAPLTQHPRTRRLTPPPAGQRRAVTVASSANSCSSTWSRARRSAPVATAASPRRDRATWGGRRQ